MFGEFYRRYVHALGKGLSEGNLSLVILGIILRLVGVILTRLVSGRKVEYGALGGDPEFLECQQIGERLDGGSGLTESKGAVDLSSAGFRIIGTADHDSQQRIRISIRRGSFRYEQGIIAHIPPSKFGERIFCNRVYLSRKFSVKSRMYRACY